MLKEYSWKVSGFQSLYDDMDANRVGAEIEALGDGVTADEIVEHAKNVNSAMHNYFEWDDSKAGHMYRKQQATKLLCNLEVTYIQSEKHEPVQVRAFVNVRQNDGFRKIETVVADVDRYQLLLNKAYNELRSIKLKYQDVEEIQERLAFLNELN